jgi:TonB-linked SusC/RagA family outer membrane protein
LIAAIAPFQAQAQNITVQGRILDASNRQPLVGAVVQNKAARVGTTADAQGKFSLNGDAKATLTVSFVGYITQDVNLNGRTNIEVLLQPSTDMFDEVVVVGYGTQKKSVVTGAISKVSAEDLASMPVSRIEQSILGRTSGVTITTSSGQPGSAATVRIRGTTTINNSDPLYVVDGVSIYGGIDYLSQGDIESIEVLKDAASASIYGARAANGVILVTTKKGKDGIRDVQYNGYMGIQAPWRKLNLLNATEYGILMNEASVAGGGSSIFTDPRSLGEGTDWQSAVFNTNAPTMNHEINMNIGNGRSNYFTSFALNDQVGIVSEAQSRFQRFNARFNSNHTLSPYFSIGNTLGYSHNKGKGVAENTEFGSPLSRAINIDPTTPILETRPDVLASSIFKSFPVVKDANGVPYGISTLVTSEVVNPVAALSIAQGSGWSDKIVGNVFAEFNPVKSVKFRSAVGVDLAYWGSDGFTPIYYLNATNRSDNTSYGRSQNKGLVWNWENTVSFNQNFGKHQLGLLAGATWERNQGEGLGGAVQNIPVTSIANASLNFPSTRENQSFYGFEYESALASYLGRINYNFDEKYLFTTVLRVDGSSKFGSNNKYGFFPSVALGWVLSKESFLANSKAINFLKLRTSWGINGNDKIGDFRYVSTVGGGRNYTFGSTEQIVNGISPNALSNPDLKWEETAQTNVGLDARFLTYFHLTFDWFVKKTSGMLLDIAVPGYVGNNGPVGNIADMKNDGLELEMGFTKAVKNVTLNLSGNISHIKNEVTYLGTDKTFLSGQRFGPQSLEITRTVVGQPIGVFFGYKTDGLFQNAADVQNYKSATGTVIQPNAVPGDFRYMDINGDGKISADDRTYIGDPTPDWTYGFTFNAAWKNMDLIVFGQGVAGNQIFNAIRRFDLPRANWTTAAFDRWTGEGTSNTFPRLTTNDTNNNFTNSSDFFIEDGSYFRIKTLQLGYTLPVNVSTRAGIKKVRLYVSGNNLLTFTKYSGFDPEIGGGSFGVDRGIYPQARSFLVGLNTTF